MVRFIGSDNMAQNRELPPRVAEISRSGGKGTTTPSFLFLHT